MSNINSYIILNRKSNFITNLFIIISVNIVISLVVVSQFNYRKYYQTYGQVVKNDNNYKYQLALYLNPYQLSLIKNSDDIIIEDVSYKFRIDYISSKYIVINDCNNCLMVVLDVRFKDKDKIVNNILEVKFLENDMKLFYYLKDYLVKGVSNEKNK